MTKRKGGGFHAPASVVEAVADIFDSSNSGGELAISDLDLGPLASLVDAVLSLGGVTSLWRDSSSGALCLSVRVGDRRRSWEFASPEEWKGHVPTLAKQFNAALAKTLRTE